MTMTSCDIAFEGGTTLVGSVCEGAAGFSTFTSVPEATEGPGLRSEGVEDPLPSSTGVRGALSVVLPSLSVATVGTGATPELLQAR